MIKRNNKKGFTIVELVIVIAVIAILAAVLIPTFAGIIKKANESADIQAVRQMNTILAAEDAYKGGLTINDAVAALTEAGLNGEDYIALVSGRYFLYDVNENRIVYTEYKDGKYNVIFPEGFSTEGHQTLSLSGDVAKEDYAEPTEVDGTYTVKIANGEQLAQLVSDLKALESGEISEIEGFENLSKTIANSTISSVSGNIVIELTSDIDFRGASFNLNLGDENSAIATNFVLKSSEGKKYTISGIANQSGFAASSNNNEGEASEYGGAFIGYAINANISFENVTFKNCYFGNENVKGSAVFVGQVTDSNVTFTGTSVENCNVAGLYGVGVYVGHSLISANNAADRTIKFVGENTVSNVSLELTSTASDRTGLVGIMTGRLTRNPNTADAGISFEWNDKAPTASGVAMTAGGSAVSDANTRWIVDSSKGTTVPVISDLAAGSFTK